MSVLNKVVDKVYVINLDKDVERMRVLDAQLKQHGIEYTRLSAIDGSKVVHSKYLTEFCNTFCTNGMKGCALSHRMIWEEMVQNGYKNVCIFEDDASLSENFNEEFEKTWDQVPNKYDIFYLGCGLRCTDTSLIPTLVNSLEGKTPTVVDTNVLSVRGSVGTHGYMISNRCAKLFYTLPILTHIDSQIDLWISQFSLAAYSANPLLVLSSGNTLGSGSNLAEAYPYALNSILHHIPFSDSFNLDWSLSENFMKLGPINFNGILTIFFFLSLLIPPMLYPIFVIWLLIEFIVSWDVVNTLKFTGVCLTAIGSRFLIVKGLYPLVRKWI
jgi:GR25 family glycosyltransferase involved in LPS biosynthesis